MTFPFVKCDLCLLTDHIRWVLFGDIRFVCRIIFPLSMVAPTKGSQLTRQHINSSPLSKPRLAPFSNSAQTALYPGPPPCFFFNKVCKKCDFVFEFLPPSTIASINYQHEASSTSNVIFLLKRTQLRVTAWGSSQVRQFQTNWFYIRMRGKLRQKGCLSSEPFMSFSATK